MGLNGESEAERQRVLATVYNLETLPKLESDAYVASWGPPRSAMRRRKTAESIAAFCRNARRRESGDMRLAVQHWEKDLRWLKRTYYDDRVFLWPRAPRHRR